MAITVVDDYTTLNAADTFCNIFVTGGISAVGMCIDTINFAQGGGSAPGKVMCSGIGGMLHDNTCATLDFTNDHLLAWGFTLDGTDACSSWRMILAGAVACTDIACFGEITAGNAGSIRSRVNSFISLSVDPKKPFVVTSGTPPAITAVRLAGPAANHTSCSNRCTFFLDEIKHGTGVTVTGGACAPRGSIELAADDACNGRGTFINIGGVFYARGRITIGDVTASTNSIFEDSNQVWNFEGLACSVSSAWHKLEFVGGTGTNRVTFGCSSGCGTAKEGFGGNTFLAGGCIPFRIEATCSSVTAEIFGSTLTGPTCLYDDHLQNFKVDDAGVFTDDTRDANDAGANDACFFPACPAACDAALFGMDERFSLLKINTGTAGAGTYTVTWEYSRCGGFTALTDVTDGTTNFKTTGCQTVSYSIPDDWIATCIDCDSRYWIRARIDCGTTTTDPVMTQTRASTGGGVRWEHTNAEMIRVTITNMDTIRLRCSAKLKKSIIQCTVAPAKSAALDFGATNPGQNIRDLTVQNNTKGILLKGSGNTTYCFRNILFSGNTSDVRVDFGMCDTITINILECGDSPSVCNVNCSTVNTNNNVCVVVNVVDTSGVAVVGATVGIYATPVCTGATPCFCGTTNACGVFSTTHNLMCDLPVSTRVSKLGFKRSTIGGTINMCGLTIPVTFIACNVVDVV